jgi:hypothetical protein
MKKGYLYYFWDISGKLITSIYSSCLENALNTFFSCATDDQIIKYDNGGYWTKK